VFVLVPLLRDYVNPFSHQDVGLDDSVHGRKPDRAWLSCVGSDSGHHDSADHLVTDARSDVDGAPLAAGGGAGAGRDALGDDQDGRSAERAHRHRGSIILGLGRALGETMAVAMVIGATPEIHRSLLANGSTMATVIANEYAEAVGDMHLSALTEIGLALFVVTIIVNALAQVMIWAVTRGTPAQAR